MNNMQDALPNSIDTISPENAEPYGVTRRELVAKVITAIGLLAYTASIYGTNSPTPEQVASTYQYLGEELVKTQKERFKVVPIKNFPRGSLNLASREEREYNPPQPPKDMFFSQSRDTFNLFESGSKIIGDYHFTDGFNFMDLHLGTHGNSAINVNSPNKITMPEGIRCLSQDSAINIYALYPDGFNLNLDRAISLAEEGLNGFTADWFEDLPPYTRIMATDIYPNESMGWLLFLQMGGTSTVEVSKTFEQTLKSTPQLYAAAVAYKTVPEMIRSLYKGPFSRRELFTYSAKAVATLVAGATGINTISKIIKAFTLNAPIAKKVIEESIESIYPFEVSEREAPDYLGRIERFLEMEEHEAPVTSVFLLLRDLVSSYKEMSLLHKEHRIFSTWGLLHDTKIGLYQTTPEQILGYIRRMRERFPNLIRQFIDFDGDTDSENVGKRVYSTALWTAALYDTEVIDGRRKIIRTQRVNFPEVRAIFE